MRLAGTSTTTKQGAHMKAARQLTSLFFPAALFLANPAEAAKPLIDTVIADPALTSITIGGSNLGGGLTVFLSGMATPLSVTSATGSQIVASLPAGLAPGSYAVRVQGAGNGNFDEFFATFVAPPSVVGGGCTSYANASATSGTFGPQVSVLQGGNYALSVKMVVNSFAGAPNSFSCSLAQSSASTITNLDQTFAFGQGELTGPDLQEFIDGFLEESDANVTIRAADVTRASFQLWASQQGDYPVRLLFEFGGKDSRGTAFNLRMEANVTDINKTVDVVAPR